MSFSLPSNSRRPLRVSRNPWKKGEVLAILPILQFWVFSPFQPNPLGTKRWVKGEWGLRAVTFLGRASPSSFLPPSKSSLSPPRLCCPAHPTAWAPLLLLPSGEQDQSRDQTPPPWAFQLLQTPLPGSKGGLWRERFLSEP